MAVVNSPQLLIADEPTTVLDAILQKKILDIIQKLQKELEFSILLITHDFSILQQIADRVCVLYEGEIVERGTPDDIVFHPQHRHTKLLSESIFTLPSDEFFEEMESYRKNGFLRKRPFLDENNSNRFTSLEIRG
jgi:ABC-type dipeptide/oligopeptide/nickel transport system ATPase component